MVICSSSLVVLSPCLGHCHAPTTQTALRVRRTPPPRPAGASAVAGGTSGAALLVDAAPQRHPEGHGACPGPRLAVTHHSDGLRRRASTGSRLSVQPPAAGDDVAQAAGACPPAVQPPAARDRPQAASGGAGPLKGGFLNLGASACQGRAHVCGGRSADPGRLTLRGPEDKRGREGGLGRGPWEHGMVVEFGCLSQHLLAEHLTRWAQSTWLMVACCCLPAE